VVGFWDYYDKCGQPKKEGSPCISERIEYVGAEHGLSKILSPFLLLSISFQNQYY
jgi:hypothetical protein